MTIVKIDIKAELKQRKLSQTKLAAKLRCSIPFLNQVISGARTSKRIQAGIAAYLSKNTCEIWPKEQKNTPAPAGHNCQADGDGVGAPDPSRG